MPRVLVRNPGQAIKNLIINGNFDYWQRGTSTTVNGYLADRFSTTNITASTITMSRVTNIPTSLQAGFQSTYSFRVETTASAAVPTNGQTLSILHSLEGYSYAEVHGKNVRIQFWCRSNVTGNYVLKLSNVNENRNYLTSFAVNASGVWEKKTIDVQLDTIGTWDFTTGRGLNIRWVLAAGPWQYGGTPNQWEGTDYYSIAGSVNLNSTLNGYFEVAQCMMTPGTFVAPADFPFERASKTIQQELAMCQRYYHRPAFELNGLAGLVQYVTLQVTSATGCQGPYNFPVTMRAAPTFSQSGNLLTSAAGGGIGVSSHTGDGVSTQSMRLMPIVASGLVAGDVTILQKNGVNDFIAFSAEL